MNQNEINVTATCIATLANQPNSEEKIKILLTSLLSSNEKTDFNIEKNNHFTPTSTIITFTQKEISNMDKDFKKILILNGLVARVRTRPSGKQKFLYEIRFRAHGYSIIVCSASLKEAKEKFLAKTKPNEIDKCKVLPSKMRRKGKNLLHQVFEEWLSLKRGNIGDKEIRRFETNFNNLPEELRYTPIPEIRAVDLDAIMKDVQPRKYEELRPSLTAFSNTQRQAVSYKTIPWL